MDGAGTSAATPQIAAAAALWLAEHRDAVSRYSQPWMRVEAVRQALFTSAAKSTAQDDSQPRRCEKIGQGVLKVDAALPRQPAAAEVDLSKMAPAEPSFVVLARHALAAASACAGDACRASASYVRARTDADGAAGAVGR